MTALTHAQIARNIVSRAPAGVFARAASQVVTAGSYLELERMLPGVRFNSRLVGIDEWELVGTCADGTVVVWRLAP